MTEDVAKPDLAQARAPAPVAIEAPPAKTEAAKAEVAKTEVMKTEVASRSENGELSKPDKAVAVRPEPDTLAKPDTAAKPDAVAKRDHAEPEAKSLSPVPVEPVQHANWEAAGAAAGARAGALAGRQAAIDLAALDQAVGTISSGVSHALTQAASNIPGLQPPVERAGERDRGRAATR